MISIETGEAGQRLVYHLTRFVNLCLAGRVPTAVRPVFCGASLCALSKKDGGIRPIAVGCTLRRLVAKAACRAVKPRMAALLAPVQLGFGIKHGIEAAVHAGRLYLQNVQRGQAVLKLDFSNAFNTLSRDELLRAVKEQVPELYPFAYICYENATHLSFGE